MSSQSNKEYSVNWKNHMNHVRKAFGHLLNSSELTDVTLCCEGRKIGSHKMLLSACSMYFRNIFKDVPCQHPVIIMYGIEYGVLLDILHFIYNGEVSVDTSKLDCFLKTAQLLQISGLTDDVNSVTTEKEEVAEAPHSGQNSEDKYADPTNSQETYTYSVSALQEENESFGRGTKRLRIKEVENKREKAVRHDSDALFESDVKCEPSELVNFEDPLEDPLQSDQPNDVRDLLGTSTTTRIRDEDFKLRANSAKNSWPIGTVKCNVCEKVFSHPYSLQQHKPVHAGNTRCSICNAVLSRKYHLKLHMKSRHNLN